MAMDPVEAMKMRITPLPWHIEAHGDQTYIKAGERTVALAKTALDAEYILMCLERSIRMDTIEAEINKHVRKIAELEAKIFDIENGEPIE